METPPPKPDSAPPPPLPRGEAGVKSAPPAAKPAPASSGGGLAWFALLLALGAGGACGWLFLQLHKSADDAKGMRAHLAALEESLRQTREENRQGVEAALASQQAAAATRETALAQRLEGSEARLSLAEEKLAQLHTLDPAQLQASLAQLEESRALLAGAATRAQEEGARLNEQQARFTEEGQRLVAELSARQPLDPRDLAEAIRHSTLALLHLAEWRILSESDTSEAVELLRLATAQARSLATLRPAFAPLVPSLETSLAQWESCSFPGFDPLTRRMALVRAALLADKPATGGDGPAETPSSWQRAWHRFLDRNVRVTRNGEAVWPPSGGQALLVGVKEDLSRRREKTLGDLLAGLQASLAARDRGEATRWRGQLARFAAESELTSLATEMEGLARALSGMPPLGLDWPTLRPVLEQPPAPIDGKGAP